MRSFCLAVAIATGLSTLLPICASAQDPVVYFADNDPVMNAAIEAARKSLPAFLERAAGGDLESGAYSVKYAYPLGGTDAEHIWVTLLNVDGEALSGVLANDANGFDGRVGDPVKFTTAEVSDWSYWGDDGLLHGAYTTRVILPELDAEQRASVEAILAPPEEE